MTVFSLLAFICPVTLEAPAVQMMIVFCAGYLMDLRGLDLPAVVPWPSESDAIPFVDIFDWDSVALDLLGPDHPNALNFQLDLCTGIFPCYLMLSAAREGVLRRGAQGSISCLASVGCAGVSMKSVTFICDGVRSRYAAVEIADTSLLVVNSSFEGCYSDDDGGAIQAYGVDSAASVWSSTFRNCQSSSFGGAISMVGGHLQVFNSSFEQCSSAAGGGALSAAQYLCYGSGALLNTTADIFGCSFIGCRSGSNGGGVLLSAAEGIIVASQFSGCESSLSGGGLSAGPQARLHIESTSFQSNVAQGYGGGAMHAHGLQLSFRALSCQQNSAPNGGGGALFLESDLSTSSGAAEGALNSSGLIPQAWDILELGCGTHSDNLAAYGPCVATSYSSLEIVGLPTPNAPAYPGLPFLVKVIKKDSYNQTITSDSVSIIKAQSVFNSSGLGIAVDVQEMTGGEALMSVTLRPFLTWQDGKAEVDLLPNLMFIGTDAQTGGTMQASTDKVEFSTGAGVCPVGSVLIFERAGSVGNSEPGYCSPCGPGTYSVDPLAGPSPSSLPACLDCLPDAVCFGGSSVTLPVGHWVVHAGAYQLVGCPAGYQLVNSVAGHFSVSAQACVACGVGHYIVNPNSSLFSCQKCPVGAICDGSNLRSLIDGAVWIVDASTGFYILVSCPPGYEKIGTSGTSDQNCQLCPAAFFCVGDTAPAEPCPDNTFAPMGANSSAACALATFVDVKIVLPLSQESFGLAVQGRFTEALGDACGALPSQIIVWSVQRLRRAASNNTILVEAHIATSDEAAATSVAIKIDASALTAQFGRQDLPQPIIQSVTVLPSSKEAVGISWSAVGGLVGLGAVILFLGVVLLRFFSQKPVVDEEAMQEAARINALRQRLGITSADGFVCGTERVPMWRPRGVPVVQIRRSQVEVATRLGAHQAFDLDHFDALCFLLYEPDSLQPSRQYAALCEWLLEISEDLIRHDIEEPHAGPNGQQFTAGKSHDGRKAGFDFFKHRCCVTKCFLKIFHGKVEVLSHDYPSGAGCARQEYGEMTRARCSSNFRQGARQEGLRRE